MSKAKELLENITVDEQKVDKKIIRSVIGAMVRAAKDEIDDLLDVKIDDEVLFDKVEKDLDVPIRHIIKRYK